MSMRNLILAATLVALGCASGAPGSPQLRTVPKVDLARYTGKWYEIGTIPSWFQKDCVGATATYSLREDGDIRVDNACRDKSLDGPERRVVGRAWVTDETTNSKLEVRFFWPFYGSYWIIELDPAYNYAVIGHPSRNYLWILSRTPQMSDALYRELLEKAREQGYDIERVKRTPQSGT
jgi:apolipoprotein D and lipocalin family protein